MALDRPLVVGSRELNEARHRARNNHALDQARGAANLKLLWQLDDTREAGPTAPQQRAQSNILARLSA
jgi:hypothetical protein